MKRYKVREVLKMLAEDGWFLKRQRGSHRQFGHRIKKGLVTVNGKPSETIEEDNIHSIFNQAGWH